MMKLIVGFRSQVGWAALTNNRVCIVIQVAQKLFQEPKAADTALQPFFGALRAAVIVLFQSAERKKTLI